jgi:hypothetical protein
VLLDRPLLEIIIGFCICSHIPTADIAHYNWIRQNDLMIDEYDKQGFVVIRGAIESSACKLMCEAMWDGLLKKHAMMLEQNIPSRAALKLYVP